MSSEGSREIEAAKKRLATAKSQASFISKTLLTAKVAEESAKQMVEIAKNNLKKAKKTSNEIQSQKQNADKEFKAAKKMLADAEKRWEVIAIDIDDEGSSKKQSSKKRKVSLSPSQASSNRPVNATAQVAARNTTNKRARWRCDAGCGRVFDSYDECLEHEHTCTAKCNTNIVVHEGLVPPR